jgi:Major Facilitator Superfamily.
VKILVTEPEKSGAGPEYRVGTLVYTLPTLLMTMVWLLWGDLCFSLMESVFPAVVPLMLKQMDTPNWMVALFLSTIPGLLNATVCPFVSYWSDRHRSRLGRRIPFILYTLPFLCLFLVLIGSVPRLAEFLVRQGWLKDSRMVAWVLMGLFVTGFQFFNMFVGSVYYYLFNDVVPSRFLGRFLAAFRVVGVLAGSGFYFFVFPIAETRFLEIFLGAALVYGIGFTLMCLFVKEGEYPPPPNHGKQSLWAGIGTFFRESFGQSFYWQFYLFVAFWTASNAGVVFVVFFAQSLGISLAQFGQYTGAGAIVSAVLLLPCGFLSDRFHPLRTLLVAVLLMAGCSLLPLVFLFVTVSPEKAFPVWCVTFGAGLPVLALFAAAELPTYMSVLPRERYGQFSAATAMLKSVFAMTAGLLCGLLLDGLKMWDPGRAYFYLPLWSASFQAVAAFFLWRLYRHWKALGGVKGYVAPLPRVPSA